MSSRPPRKPGSRARRRFSMRSPSTQFARIPLPGPQASRLLWEEQLGRLRSEFHENRPGLHRPLGMAGALVLLIATAMLPMPQAALAQEKAKSNADKAAGIFDDDEKEDKDKAQDKDKAKEKTQDKDKEKT